MREKKKQVIIISIVLAITIIISILINLQQGLYIGSDFFRRLDEGLYQYNKENLIEATISDDGQAFDIIWNGVEQSAKLRWEEDTVVILYDDGTELAGRWDGERLVDENGMPLAFHTDELVTIVVNNEKADIGKGTLGNALCRISYRETETRGSLWCTVVGTVLYLLGAAVFLFPEESYFFLQRWRFREAELSDTGLAMQKASGVLGMAVGVILAIFTVWLV